MLASSAEGGFKRHIPLPAFDPLKVFRHTITAFKRSVDQQVIIIRDKKEELERDGVLANYAFVSSTIDSLSDRCSDLIRQSDRVLGDTAMTQDQKVANLIPLVTQMSQSLQSLLELRLSISGKLGFMEDIAE
jgi:hypothetical protein